MNASVSSTRTGAVVDPVAARWLMVALSSLLVAGLFALFLVVGRVPALATHFSDPELFKRCLVVHVDLSLVVWFYAFLGALFAALPSSKTSAWSWAPLAVTLSGLALLLYCIGLDGAKPVLSNYVPGIDHPLFLVAIGLVLLGVAGSFLHPRLVPGVAQGGLLTPAAAPGVRAGAVSFLFALLTLAASVLSVPSGLPPETRLELTFWGGGHVLQFASEAAMVAVWLTLLERSLGKPVVSARLSSALFGLMLLGPALAPVLAMRGVQHNAIHSAFTELMRWGIFPIVTVFLVLCVRAVLRAVRSGEARWSDPSILAFVASAALTVFGFGLGALIRGSTTLVPAHYHANIGAVTCAFMAITPAFASWCRRAPVEGRLGRAIRWQPVLYGSGQLVFALGFALAGAHGMARKSYASEQHVRTALEWLGLTVMGVGGLVAVLGGVLFLAWAVKAFGLTAFSPQFSRRHAWPNQLASRPFRS